MLSRAELIKRGARFKGGDALRDEDCATVIEKKADPVQPTQIIDTSPIADAMSRLSDVVRSAIDANAPMINKLIELHSSSEEKKKPNETWEFTILRDSRGRIESIKASSV